jgi:CyaY protein
MLDSEYHQLADQTLTTLEQALDNAEIDYERNDGILSLEFANGSKIIINKQAINQEIWIAAKSGGFHLKYIDNQWHTSKQEELFALLSRLCSEQSATTIILN